MRKESTNLTGPYCVKLVLLTKYGLAEVRDLKQSVSRLTNQLWKLIPMRENEEDWQKQLESLIIELTGLNEILIIDSNLMSLLSKLEGLRLTETDFFIYRKTVFEAISLLQRFANDYTQ